MKRCLLLACLLLSSNTFANDEQGCSVSDLLTRSKVSVFKSIEEVNCTEEVAENMGSNVINTAITEELMSVKVLHERREIVIRRELLDNKKTCPPFCIEPMNIEGVQTVGELEVLTFINKLKEKKARLLIDVRESKLYVQGSIPGAINLPFTMIEPKSAYREEVLTLLGAKAFKNKNTVTRSFKEAQSLLIFGNSSVSNEASKIIKELLKLGYPRSKLLYYRAGVSSWKALGLTLVLKN